MAGFVAMTPEEIKREKELEHLRFEVLTDLLSGEPGNTPFIEVYNIYKRRRGSFFNRDSYNIPRDFKVGQDLILEEIPLAFYDCWLSEEDLISKRFDILEEFSKIYIRCDSTDHSWHDVIQIFDFVNDEIWPELRLYKQNLSGNINIYLKSYIEQKNVKLTIRQPVG